MRALEVEMEEMWVSIGISMIRPQFMRIMFLLVVFLHASWWRTMERVGDCRFIKGSLGSCSLEIMRDSSSLLLSYQAYEGATPHLCWE
jgi:hypothetical protein